MPDRRITVDGNDACAAVAYHLSDVVAIYPITPSSSMAENADAWAAAAKFAVAGKRAAKKDLGLMAMAYGHVYVTQVAFGAKDAQTLKAFLEAESYPGPSLILAYSHCIAHGYDMAFGLEPKLAADSGYWPLYRYDPRRAEAGEPPLVVDSPPPKTDVGALMAAEARFQATAQQDPERYAALLASAQEQIRRRLALYTELATKWTSPPATSG